jgi:hypothetical protein
MLAAPLKTEPNQNRSAPLSRRTFLKTASSALAGVSLGSAARADDRADQTERVFDLAPLIDNIESIVASHTHGEPGKYRRWLWQDKDGARELGVNPYGCADAANILYTIGRFPRDARERQGWIAALQDLQEPSGGLYHEATHHEIHTTAHCLAALELFDAGPRHRLAGLAEMLDADKMEHFLDDLDWRGNPWPQSHRGAGLYAALVLAGEAPREWQERYFAWLWNEADPETGFWRKGCIGPVKGSIFPHLAGSFHYLFNHQYARRPLRYPQAMIDACLDIYKRRLYPTLGARVNFAEIDWIYCLTRALRQCGHRFADCHDALRDFAGNYIAYLNGLDPKTDDGLNDLHMLFGATCALAELQQALPGTIRTARPLKLVLDRRPFI